MANQITYHRDLVQGSDEWLAARCGLITASEMKLMVTPGGKPSWNDKTRAHLYELAAQRLTGRVEPQWISDDMLRGQEDEMWARMAYIEHIAPVQEVGFITNSRWGFTLGYSPDGLVGDDGLLEIKSRRQKFQIQTILENVPADRPAQEFTLQCQTGLLVAERDWIDFVSYANGMRMVVIRVFPDEAIQAVILEAASMAEAKIAAMLAKYGDVLASHPETKLIPVPRREDIGDRIL